MINGLVWRSWIFLPGLALVLAAPIPTQSSVTLSPATLAFGNQVQGTTSAAKTVTLQNVKTAALTITSIAVTGNFAQQTGGTCPLSPAKLAKSASCTILISFTPATLGTLSGKLTVTDSASNSPQIATLTGKGIAPVTVSPTNLTFAKLPVGETSAALTVTLTNNQSTALNFNSILTTGDFAVASNTNTCGSSIAAAPSSCTVGVTFSPTATGTRRGSLTFSDSAANTPQTVTLTGIGSAAVLDYITVTPANSTIFAGDTQQLTATGTYSNNTTKNLSTSVTWTALPLGIASISTTGLATGLTAGSTTVTAALGAITNLSPVTLTVIQLFVPTGSLNTARYYHSATLLDTGVVLVAGGIGPVPGGTGALGELASAELYNPGTGTFTFTGNLNIARDQHSATLLNNGSVLIAGGSGALGELVSAEIYDPATAAFTFTRSLNTARYEHTATMLPDGTVLIAGGYGSAGVLSSAEIYNPATQTFTVTVTGLNAARFDAAATSLPNGLVLIAGGADANGPLSSAELYDPIAGTFTTTANSLNVARSGATATLLDTGQVLIANGYNYLTTGPLTSAELYDPIAGTFTLTGSLTMTAWLGTATLLTNSGVLFAGSVLNASPSEIYNPATGAFFFTGGLNTPRDLQTATQLPNGAVLIAGGHSNAGSAVLAAAELFEPAALAPPNLVSIAITPFNPSLAVGASQQLVATGTFSDNSTQQLAAVVWSSSNPTAAPVTNDETNSGVVYGAAAGITIVSACTGTVCQATPVTVTSGAAVRR
jgi:hypothetical protein